MPLAAAPPVRDTGWTMLGEGLVYLKLVLVVLAFDPQAADTFGLTKSAVTHAFSGALAAVLVLIMVSGQRAPRWSPIHLGVAAVVVAFAAATPLALDPTVALFGAWRRYLGLTQILDNALLYLAAVVLFQSGRAQARLLSVVLATALPVIAYTFVQRAGLDVVVYKDAPTSLRPIATLGQPDILGAYASIGAVTAVAAALYCFGPAARAVAVAGGLAIAAGCLAVELVVGVRAGVLGMLAGWGAMAAIAAVRPVQRTLALGAVGVIGLLILGAIVLTPLGSRLTPEFLRTDPGVLQRIEIWETSLKLVVARPLLGLGPDNFAAGYPAHRLERGALLVPGELQNSTHSWLAYVATSAGLLGTAALIGWIVLVLASGLALARRADPAAVAAVTAAAYLGQGLVGINDLSLDWTLWVAAGVIAARSQGPALAFRPYRPDAVVRVTAAAAVALVALAGAAGAAERIRGSEMLAQSQANVAANNGPAAIPYARSALLLDPRRAELWSFYGAALDASNSLVAAAAAFREATDRSPWYPLHWRNLALVSFLLGNQSSAFSALERANQADPHDAETRDLSARVWLGRGDAKRAAEEGALAVRLAPANLGAYDAPVLANLQLERYAEAAALLRTALANGDAPFLHLRLAQVYAATSRLAEARAEVDAVLRSEPSNVEAQRLRDRLQSLP